MQSEMGSGELKFPEWQAPLQELILESDLERLFERIQEVETLIFKRRQQLPPGIEDLGERESLNDALYIIRTIRRDKLGSPDAVV